jgi:hypothetical protein
VGSVYLKHAPPLTSTWEQPSFNHSIADAVFGMLAAGGKDSCGGGLQQGQFPVCAAARDESPAGSGTLGEVQPPLPLKYHPETVRAQHVGESSLQFREWANASPRIHAVTGQVGSKMCAQVALTSQHTSRRRASVASHCVRPRGQQRRRAGPSHIVGRTSSGGHSCEATGRGGAIIARWLVPRLCQTLSTGVGP